MKTMHDPTARFSTKVENYRKYRPSYPAAIIETIREDCGLMPDSIIADVGSGTGLLTELFLKNGNTVFGVEPNEAMRAAGESYLHAYTRFTSIAASAEATTLPSMSVDFITAGQAFHWFDVAKTRAEFMRILKPHGWAALVWNHWETTGSELLASYERLLQTFGTDYREVNNRVDATSINAFYGSDAYTSKTFKSNQVFDPAGLRGRLLSSSFVPEPGHPNYEPMLEELARLFYRHAVAGRVTFDYDTKLYYGRLSS